jgi:hypothetical protein
MLARRDKMSSSPVAVGERDEQGEVRVVSGHVEGWPILRAPAVKTSGNHLLRWQASRSTIDHNAHRGVPQMSRRNAPLLEHAGLGAIAAVSLALLAVVVVGCSSITVGPGSSSRPPEPTFREDFTEPTPLAGGHWTGTITFHGVVSVNKTEPGHSDLDPSNTYYETWVTTEVTQLDATDTFTIAAADDDDLTYGIHSVDLDGSATNSGTTLERSVKLTDKQNSGCTWKQEDGSETTGSWSGSGQNVGEIHFSEDGSYSIDIYADTNGEYAEVPHHDWLKYSEISANCEVNFAPFDNPSPGGPIVEWVSSHLEEDDVNGDGAFIEGRLNPSSPGSVVDGTSTWEMRYPEGFTMTVTWHLVHDSPIVVPHS